MPAVEDIEAAVYHAVDQVNALLPAEVDKLEKTRDEALIGRRGKLDSLGLVNLITAVEEQLLDRLDVSLTLADERALSRRRSPFMTLGTLIDYVAERTEEDHA